MACLLNQFTHTIFCEKLNGVHEVDMTAGERSKDKILVPLYHPHDVVEKLSAEKPLQCDT